MSMSRKQRIVVMVAAVVGIVSTPAIWLLDGPDTAGLVGASIQAATGVAALVWAWAQSRAATAGAAGDTATQTGRAEASGGGQAHTGVRRRGDGSPGPARVQDTGDAVSRGAGSNAGTGIDYTD
ncbi:hypothetical protein ACGFSI_42525 [Streptomyces virginiae]|uniref:hypothetical protein n=1 Tax=Streptomyces virginiae TaxID=1961 RepID=UPI00371325A3